MPETYSTTKLSIKRVFFWISGSTKNCIELLTLKRQQPSTSNKKTTATLQLKN
jgi:hypothetical protein